MQNRFKTAGIFGLSVSASLMTLPGRASGATVVYNNLNVPTEFIDQQYGNNFYYLGDTVTVAPTVPAGNALATISIPFATTYYNAAGTARSAFTYTPNLTLDLYPNAASANTGTGKIGSATVSSVLFSNDGVIPAGRTFNDENRQLVTFDFTSQNLVLPPTFTFAYHDTPPVGSDADGAAGLSVFVTSGAAMTGLSDNDYFAIYPNTPPTLISGSTLEDSPGYNVEAQITAVPEPASFSLLGLGGVGMLMRRRVRTR